MTIIETTGIIGLILTNTLAGIYAGDKIIDQAEKAVATAEGRPFGNFTADEEREAGLIIMHAVEDEEYILKMQNAETEEEVLNIQKDLNAKYKYISAGERQKRALELMDRYN